MAIAGVDAAQDECFCYGCDAEAHDRFEEPLARTVIDRGARAVKSLIAEFLDDPRDSPLEIGAAWGLETKQRLPIGHCAESGHCSESECGPSGNRHAGETST